jgi:Tfp pilus assembly protein PilZ
MPTQVHPRVRKRMPCEVSIGDARHQGFVLNVSRGGLYVQTSAGVEVGSLVKVELTAPASTRSIPLQARVVWRRVQRGRAFGVNEGGMGLSIQSAPASYDALLDDLLPRAEGSAASPAPPGGAAAPRFQVRLRLAGSQRSRTLVVASDSDESARSRALAQLGPGWTVLELRPAGRDAQEDGSGSDGGGVV